MERSRRFRNWTRSDFIRALIWNEGVILIIGYLFYGTLLAAVPGSALQILLLKEKYKEDECRRRERLELEFREALHSLKAAMHAGYAAENAIREARRELVPVYGEDSAIAGEFQYMCNEIEMKIPVEEAWRRFGERSGIGSIKDFALIFKTARRSGGNLNEIISNTADIIGQKIQIRHDIQTIVAARKLEWRVMTMIPPGIILYMKAGFPDFMQYLYGNPAGIMIMTVSLLCFAGAICWGKHILKIEI